ncbi:hypothetical protein L7F22_005817 [Adiantum nelumboides]|nr:hypothetical protein [Adiantum nelumboides]
MDRDRPFFDLEEDIAYFKGEGDVIVFGDMNARTKTLQHDTRQFDMPYISKELEEVHLYNRTSMDEKEPDHNGKLLLHMCNSTAADDLRRSQWRHQIQLSAFMDGRGHGETGDSGQSTADLTAFVQNLLQQMQARFQTMSESIITKIDEMGSRIDDLEKSISDLTKEMGVEMPSSKSAGQGL